MTRQENSIWVTDVNNTELADFMKFDHALYMYRIIKDNGEIAYRSDIFSRCQIGYGNEQPAGPYYGKVSELDGTVSCSVVVDPDMVTKDYLEPIWPETKWIHQDEFWQDEARFPSRPQKLEDLIIYELHVGALGFGKANDEPGTLNDAIKFLDYLVELGVNAIELLPMSEYGGGVGGWGYSTSHFFAIEYSGGGRDQYKHFIRECHKKGIAVILDVVYNHYNHNAERAEYMYDTVWHDKNCYYWYEGKPNDYPVFEEAAQKYLENPWLTDNPPRAGEGGYLDNLSTAYAPRYHEESVRKMFISSAIALIEEFHIDGFRVDQTTSIHAYNRLHADGRIVEEANKYGKKLLREFTRTLKLIKPEVILMAEDHSNEEEVTNPSIVGGMGFDAVWYADFYHHLIGDTDKGQEYAKLLKTAGTGGDGALAIDYFAGALANSGNKKIVYHESHDEAGNGSNTDRNFNVAGSNRKYSEARCRFVAGVTLLSAGTPMFLFGEEVCAEKKFWYGKVLENREDLQTLKKTTGRNHFNFYKQLIQLRKSTQGLKSQNIEIIYTHNQNRVLAFRRWNNHEEYLIVGSLNNQPYNNPDYCILSDKIYYSIWREIFNSDAQEFGGDNIGNLGAEVQAQNGRINCIVPANGLIVFKRSS